MAGKAEEDDDDDEEEQVRWRVTDGSSEAEVHPATNVLHPDLFRFWQTHQPCEEAWLVVEPRSPTAFSRVEVVNAGSSLVEIHGWRQNGGDYELLLSPQQVMTVKDLMSKANRNRALAYDIDTNRKLSPVAAQQRWSKLRIYCRQPFGTTEHRACIGLAYINFKTCKPRSDDGIQVAAKRRVTPEVLRSGTEGNHQKRAKQIVQQNSTNLEYEKVIVKPEPQDYDALPLERLITPGLNGIMSEMKIRKQSTDIGKEFVEERKPNVGKVMNQDTVVEKTMKRKLVIGMGTATTSDPSECQAFRLASSPFPRKDHGSVSMMKSRNHNPDRNEFVGNRKSKIEDIKEEVVSTLSDNVQTSPCTLDRTRKSGKTQNVDIGVNAAQAVGKSEHVHAKRGGEAAQAKLNSAQELGNAGKARLEGLTASSSMKTTTGNKEDFAKILEGVVFAISGIQNPSRGSFRTQGLEMGAEYRPDWTSDCTVLVCAFKDTPKFKQVKAVGGSIVSKEWISECHKQRKLVSIERFLMHKGRPWRKPVYKANCGSLEEVRDWVYDDLASTSNWLQQRDPKPESEELEFIAAQGIMVCFEDAIRCIQDNQIRIWCEVLLQSCFCGREMTRACTKERKLGVSSIVESWGCLPRAIKELSALEEGREGYKKGARSHMLEEAARLKHVYTDILNPIFVACSKTPQRAINKKKR